jgi:hypothetical protein
MVQWQGHNTILWQADQEEETLTHIVQETKNSKGERERPGLHKKKDEHYKCLSLLNEP